jgi:hypothetical protein
MIKIWLNLPGDDHHFFYIFVWFELAKNWFFCLLGVLQNLGGVH